MRKRRSMKWMYFNPHSREGSDVASKKYVITGNISIHTPAKGVTNGEISPTADTLISIHTPAKGVTTVAQSPGVTRMISIHTPAKGVTIHLVRSQTATEFQSTLPRRE